jgi:LDH2 family malate/lactate/ureidoglycolate dehydrogenase
MTGNDNIWIQFDLLEDFMTKSFEKMGLPRKEAKICADVLITADKRGIASHGINRFKPFYYDRINAGIQSPTTEIEIVREGPTTAVIDGHNGMGMVIAKKSMDIAIKKAKKYGMGMVTVRNSTHYGIAGYYAMMATQQDMIGVTGTNARPSVAPTFGVEGMFGTNPLVFGMPSDEDFPFVSDYATSLAQRGRVEVYARTGKPLPEGWVIGKDGKSRTDSQQALKDFVTGDAALVPLGGIGEENAGYKGYGFATVVEILSAALQQGSYLKMLSGIDENGGKRPIPIGHFFIAIDINAFVDPAAFKKTTGDILRALRASQKAPGAKRIYTAGEKEYFAWLDRKEKGVPVNASLQKDILDVQKELQLTSFKFPF